MAMQQQKSRKLNDILLDLSLDLNKWNPAQDPNYRIRNIVSGEIYDRVNAHGLYPSTDIEFYLTAECPEKEFTDIDDANLSNSFREVIENSLQSFGEWRGYREFLPSPEFRGIEKCVKIRARKNGSVYEVEIEDNGSGIAPDHMLYVGTIGYTRKQKHGFAMALIRSMLATVYHGKLIVESSGLKNSKGEVLSPEEFTGRIQLISAGRALGMDVKAKSWLENELEPSEVYKGTKVTITLEHI